MSRFIEDPVSVEKKDNYGPDRTIVTTHPAFGQISASRVSGEEALYGSDFISRNYMTIRIRKSELHRSLNRDWHRDTQDIVEIALTESQWATFVSSPNMGGGVPCTIQRLDGQVIPGLPDPQARTDQFKGEMEKSFAGIIEKIDQLIAKAKTKNDKFELGLLKQDIEKNLPYVAKQFGEHMEGTFEAAKQEFHGYMTNVLISAGLNALEASRPLELGHDRKEEPNEE